MTFSVQSQKIVHDVGVSIHSYKPDFVIANEARRKTKSCSLRSVILCVPNLIFRIGFYVSTRIAMSLVYPAQSRIAKVLNKSLRSSFLDKNRAANVKSLQDQGYTVRRVILQKGSLKLDGIAVMKGSSLKSSKWIFQVTGCGAPIETSFHSIAREYLDHSDYSLFMVNGPSIGRSSGHATFDSLIAAQECGIKFLEDKIQATHIALVGHSFGRAILGEALLRHKFKANTRYLVCSQMAFNQVSHIVRLITGCCITRSIIRILNLDIDVAQSSMHLEITGIKEVIFQSTRSENFPGVNEFVSDGIIPSNATLGEILSKQKWINKLFIGLGKIGHAHSFLWFKTIQVIKQQWES